MGERLRRSSRSGAQPSRKCLIGALGSVRANAPVWVQGVVVRVKSDCFALDDASGVIVVNTSLLASLDAPGADTVERLHVGAYVMVVASLADTHVLRATTVRALEIGGMAESMWHVELCDAFLRARDA